MHDGIERNFTSSDLATIQRTTERFKPNTQIAIAKIQNDRMSFYGVMVGGNKEVTPVSNHTSIFEIGSITKVLTSTLLAQLVIEGTIKLDDTIDRYLGYKLANDAQITFEGLSNHTAGLPRLPPSMLWKAIFGSSENPYKDYNADALKHDITSRIKLKKTGKSRYSNLGAGLLAHTLGEITGQSFEIMLKERIFEPLGMHSSAVTRERCTGQLVTGLNKKGHPTKGWDFISLAGAGAVLSSVEDLAKFIQANFDTHNKAFQLQQKQTIKTGKWDSFALGWMIQNFKTTNDRPWHWHNGGTGGFSSTAVMDLEKRTGVVILSNVSGLSLFKSEEITNMAFNLHKDMQNTD